MTTSAVVNASPLIYLARADLLDLLRLAGDDVVVTSTVLSEIEARGPDDPTAAAVRATAWLRPVKAPVVPTSVTAWDLGPGESSVIAWALANPASRAVIDDLQGRRCASSLGVSLRGTLGLAAPNHRPGVKLGPTRHPRGVARRSGTPGVYRKP